MTLLKRVSMAILAVCLIAVSANGQAPTPTPNAALRYWMAFALLRDPPADQATADLLESVAAGSASWDEARLGKILDANSEALEVMQRGASLAFCDWGVEYDLGSSAPIAHLAKARVLARLNALAGMRLAARGQLAQAVGTWLAGVRFSQHVAQGGTLISLLTARSALTPPLHALNRVAADALLGVTKRNGNRRGDSSAAGHCVRLGRGDAPREGALNVTVQQLSRASDPKAYYRTTMGAPAPDRFTVPSAADVKHFHDTMARIVDALRLAPDQARARLGEIEADRKTLHPFFQQTLPMLSRMNETRAEIRADRQQLLDAVSIAANTTLSPS